MTEPTLNFQIQTSQTQFRIPIELIKKNFKNIQKLIEKEKKQLMDEISIIKKNPNIPKSMKLELIKKLIKGFESFQKKLKTAVSKDEEYRSRLVARLEHLNELDKYCITTPSSGTGSTGGGGSTSNKGKTGDDTNNNTEGNDPSTKYEDDKLLDLHNPNLLNWYRDQTNLLIVDYLIKSNIRSDENAGILLLKSLAEKNPNFMKLIDYDLFHNFNKVFVSIVQDHDLSLVIAWFNENRNFLKKVNSNLEFEINYCKFLSLIEKGDINEATRYSRTTLSPYGNRENYQQTDKFNHLANKTRLLGMGGLLMFRSLIDRTHNGNTFSSNLMVNSPQYHEYQKLLSEERWEGLSQCFIENFTKLYGISKNYPIFIYLSAGLSSLKTKSCYYNTENTIFRDINEEIPIDSTKPDSPETPSSSVLTSKKYRGPNKYYKVLNKINNCPVCSPELYELSKNLPYAQLITSIFNNPFKLPNGNIYPFDKLLNPSEKHLSEKNTLLRMGKVKDPLTKEIFFIDHCVRVFPA
ncbi:FYV10 [[Candida] subhashii]|uniref:FYV10 n=1 Tax=[Candida] subhashii TaxID=561895 RepID=A0A8J5UP82_9ASCO|nr:FYV10 [[Candida] subhashii]KAG7664096.1 FYV10 [[Candida] subhashii]